MKFFDLESCREIQKDTSYFDHFPGSSGRDFQGFSSSAAEQSFFVSSKPPHYFNFPYQCFFDRFLGTFYADHIEGDKIATVNYKQVSFFDSCKPDLVDSKILDQKGDLRWIKEKFIGHDHSSMGPSVINFDFAKMEVISDNLLPIIYPVGYMNPICIDEIAIVTADNKLFILDTRCSSTSCFETCGMTRDGIVSGNKVFYRSQRPNKSKDLIIEPFCRSFPYKLFRVSPSVNQFIGPLTSWHPSVSPFLVYIKPYSDPFDYLYLVDPNKFTITQINKIPMAQNQIFYSPHYLCGQPVIFKTSPSEGKISVADF